ncbi:TRCF domain-containing protein [Sphingomonas sp. S2-65]|uniref:TRCF domain-containing protein n=1 Tax=Sphingomonas sp. S2-65 TaxID=2903960 RepID=UPI001F1EB0AF|nr:TRCF domain-containing protein [Sphingomonas sp. S2-65]UYY60238.1 helicase-related protein [Sphingomonas sp. S2-65]
MRDGDVVFLAPDEARAGAVERALSAAMPEAAVIFCPGSDALPGDSAPASPANVGQRVAALRRLRVALAAQQRVALISTGEAAGRLYPAPLAFDTAPPLVETGQAIDLAAFAETLVEIGYIHDERVDEPGEVALRGQVIDVFPADAGLPYRIEAQDGHVAWVRPYDAATQLTTGEAERLELGRVNEPELEDPVSLLDHVPGAAVAMEPEADKRRRRFLALAADAERQRPGSARRVCDEARWTEALAERAMLALAEGGEPPARFVESRTPMRAFAKVARAAMAEGDRVALLGSTRDLRFLKRRVLKVLGGEAIEATRWADVAQAAEGSLVTLTMPVERGFRVEGVTAIAAGDLLGSRAKLDDGHSAASGAELFDLGDIRVGDVVVHEDHGIGVVEGLAPLPVAEGEPAGDAIQLRYAEDGRRLVPVTEADRIWRYGADEDAVTLDRLDGSSWQKRRGAINEAVEESARALLALTEERAQRTAPALDPDPALYERFASGFPFIETPDQARAIQAVRDDLASGRPMDRLVIGDVGYGKTEVALRAAALAALAGRQVAVAAPTTVLARQHLESFTRRFEGTGIAVAGLSRLSSPAEKKAVKAGLADGSVGVVIGTGAVAGKGVEYKDLALVVIDEEQRFGAADKNRLREMGGGHVLTLSATPIPRTLQSALVGLQQLSVIATPPARRQPIRTSVMGFDPQVLRTALLREKSRGGQSFVVVPRIEDMAPLAERLAKLVPELKVLDAHGKLAAQDLDGVMVGFANGEGDVLLATNIIEAGLDVPRANTMVVWRADRFGLSQLHQLRGRVGRGSRRGQVLLVTDPDTEIAPRTLTRLRTLQAFDRLGAGFAISARDLDMRGAGDLLGEAQAGHMKLIGIDLYQHLLEIAVRRTRGEDVERWTAQLNLGLHGRLPDDWVPEEELRVTLYARLARIDTIAGMDSFEAELEDRFGELPEEAQTLVTLARTRLLARSAGIRRVDAGPAALAFTPDGSFEGDPQAHGLAEKNGRLLLAEAIEEPAARLQRVEALLAELAS